MRKHTAFFTGFFAGSVFLAALLFVVSKTGKGDRESTPPPAKAKPAPEEDSGESLKLPPIEQFLMRDLRETDTRSWLNDIYLTKKKKERTKTIIQYSRYNRKLISKLLPVIDAKTGKKYSKRMRANACAVLALSRTTWDVAIKTLISVVEYQFIEARKDSRYDINEPAGALMAIGKPAEPFLLKALSAEENKKRRRWMCIVLWVIEEQDEDLITVIFNKRIAKEKDKTKADRLKKALKFIRNDLLEEEKENAPDR